MKKENKALAKQMRAEAKKKAALKKKILIIGGIVLAVVLVVGAIVGAKIADEIASRPITQNFSKYLTEDGKIKGINISEYMTLGDLEKALEVKSGDIEPTEAEIMEVIRTALSGSVKLNTKATAVLKEGDKINIDYVGYIDDVAFDGGNTNDKGTDLVLGSGSYIDDFEDQLIGHKVGDEVEVKVTFPDEYSNNPDLEGKEAVFKVEINGLYELALTDELVEKEIKEYKTVEEYREAVRQDLRDEKAVNTVWTALIDSSKMEKYPEKFTDNLYELQVYYYQAEYEYMNQMYYSSYGSYGWNSMLDYYGMTEEELIEEIEYATSVDVLYSVICQAIYEEKNLSVTDADKAAFIESLGYDPEKADKVEEAEYNYGKNYITHGAITMVVEEYLKDNVKVVEGTSEDVAEDK